MDVWNYLLKDTLLGLCSHTKRGWHHEFLGEGDTYMVVSGLLKVKKPQVLWFKASLVAVLSFSCVPLLLIPPLLTLRKGLKA